MAQHRLKIGADGFWLQMIHYPSATDIHEQLEDQRKWSRFKHAQVQRVLTRAGRRKDTPLCVRSSS